MILLKKTFSELMEKMFKTLYLKISRIMGIFMLTGFIIVGCKVNQPVVEEESTVTEGVPDIRENQGESVSVTWRGLRVPGASRSHRPSRLRVQ